jgi:endonuclease YncB( thermonuclease family)
VGKLFKRFFPWNFLPVLLIFSVFINIYQFVKLKQFESGIRVIEVLDGDTLLLEGDVRVRLRNVDAPELAYCGGVQAKEVLKKLVKEKKVVLKEQLIDQWGRPMALIYIGNKLINLEMIKSGWVRYHHDQSTMGELMKKSSDLVRTKGIGIWSNLCYQKENKENPLCNIKGNIDKNSSDRKYYLPGCAQYDFTIVEKDLGEDWFCSENEALNAGFTKAETCK